MSPPADPASLTPAATLLQAADALLQWQLATPPGGLPALAPARLRQGPDAFVQHYLLGYRRLQLAEPLNGLLANALQALLAEVTALPLAPTRLQDEPHPVLAPAPWGIAALTRGGTEDWDEALALDVTIRYWQKARTSDLGLPEDFGEFYRAVEWVGLLQQLSTLGRLAAEGGQAMGAAAAAGAPPRLLQGAHATADRYRELKAVACVLEQAEGVQPAVGFAYGRV